MIQQSFNAVLMEQAMDHADAFGMSLGEVLMYYWMMSFQHLYSLDPEAVTKIDAALKELTHDIIDLKTFYETIARPSREIEEMVDINVGALQRH